MALIAAGAAIPITVLDINTGIATERLTAFALACAVYAFTENGAVIITGSTVGAIDHQIRTESVATGHPDPATGRIAGIPLVLVLPDRAPGNDQGAD